VSTAFQEQDGKGPAAKGKDGFGKGVGMGDGKGDFGMWKGKDDPAKGKPAPFDMFKGKGKEGFVDSARDPRLANFGKAKDDFAKGKGKDDFGKGMLFPMPGFGKDKDGAQKGGKKGGKGW
jgi:hypothetical protein